MGEEVQEGGSSDSGKKLETFVPEFNKTSDRPNFKGPNDNNIINDNENTAKTDSVPDFSQLQPLASGLRTRRMWHITGDTDDAMWSCGQSVGLIQDSESLFSCRHLMESMCKEAKERIGMVSKL